MNKCKNCGEETLSKLWCSNSCRCKFYYKENKEEQKERLKKAYWERKSTDYAHLREINKRASKKYKLKNIDRIREAGREYQRRTKSSLKFHNTSYFGSNQKIVMDRDCHLCKNCGSGSKLVVHHIDGSGGKKNSNNALENLVTLCRACHLAIHRKQKIPA